MIQAKRVTSQSRTSSKRDWTPERRELLQEMVLANKLYDWNLLAQALLTSPSEVLRQWQTKIYPTLKNKEKIAGFLKWSRQEDQILTNCFEKDPYNWSQISQFLPGRTVCSIEARWKRITFSTLSLPDAI